MSILLVAAPVISFDSHNPGSILTAMAENSAKSFETTADDFRYENCGDYIKITGYKSRKYGVSIPSEIEGIPVTKIDTRAFYGDTDVAHIYMPVSVEEIGDEAFAKCPNLQFVDFSPKLKKIGMFAFSECPGLDTVVLPDSVNYIGEGAFSYSYIRHLVLSESLDRIRQMTFAYNPALETIIIPDSVERIEREAFKGCTALRTVCYKGSSNMWSLLSIDRDNDPLYHATLICDYNKQTVERSERFDPEKDTWSFSNKDPFKELKSGNKSSWNLGCIGTIYFATLSLSLKNG